MHQTQTNYPIHKSKLPSLFCYKSKEFILSAADFGRNEGRIFCLLASKVNDRLVSLTVEEYMDTLEVGRPTARDALKNVEFPFQNMKILLKGKRVKLFKNVKFDKCLEVEFSDIVVPELASSRLSSYLKIPNEVIKTFNSRYGWKFWEFLEVHRFIYNWNKKEGYWEFEKTIEEVYDFFNLEGGNRSWKYLRRNKLDGAIRDVNGWEDWRFKVKVSVRKKGAKICWVGFVIRGEEE